MWRSGEGGAHRAEASQCGQNGHYRMWLLSSIALRPEMGQDLLFIILVSEESCESS